MDRPTAPTYGELLRLAKELGEDDGRFAAAFEFPSPVAGGSGRCLGRTPDEFARLLWDGRRGAPPVGLLVNAPLWYAAGFADGLAAGAAELRRLPDTAQTQ